MKVFWIPAPALPSRKILSSWQERRHEEKKIEPKRTKEDAKTGEGV